MLERIYQLNLKQFNTNGIISLVILVLSKVKRNVSKKQISKLNIIEFINQTKGENPKISTLVHSSNNNNNPQIILNQQYQQGLFSTTDDTDASTEKQLSYIKHLSYKIDEIQSPQIKKEADEIIQHLIKECEVQGK